MTTVLLTVVAYRLLAGRDVGAGLIAERAGPGTAATWLRGVDGLTWRLDRGALLLWTVGLCLYGVLMGSVVHGIGDELGDSAVARDIVARMGGTTALEQAFVAVAFTMMGMVAAAFAISLTLRPHQEESGQRAETTLAGASRRTRWLASHLAAALAGSAVAMLIAGVAAGLIYGVAAGDVGGKLSVVVGTAAVQLPAVWLLVRGDRRVVRARAAVHPGGVGGAGRFVALVPDRFAGGLPAVGARPRAVRAHSTGRRRRLHGGPAAMAAGHRCDADHAGRHGFSTA